MTTTTLYNHSSRMLTGRGEPVGVARAADRAMRRYLDARAVGRRLAWARQSAGISRDLLGAYAGCSPSTIRRIEHGERLMSPPERAVISRALGVSLAMFTADAIAPPASTSTNGRAAA